jgi:hypothetical protein
VLANHRPIDAFVIWFDTLAAYIRVKHGLGEALHTAAVQDVINQTYAPVERAVERLISACVVDGTMRSGLNPSDVLLVMGFLWRVAPSAAGSLQAKRATRLVLDGLKAV